MQIKKALTNDCLPISKVPGKFRISTTYNFGVTFQWNLLFSLKLAYLLTASIVFSVYKRKLTTHWLE